MLTLSKRFTFLLMLTLLQACSGPGPGGGFSSGGGSGPGTTFEPTEVVGIRIEAGFGANEINNLPTNRISIVALNHDFLELSGLPSSVPDHQVEEREFGGGYEIQFVALFVEQIDVVVKVRLDSGEVLYAPLHSLANPNDTITVNVGSHYVLEKLFDTVNSEAELNELLPCASGVNDCPNQFLAKASLLGNIGKAAQGYEIDILNNATFSEAKVIFDQNADFRAHIETAVNEISRVVSPIAKGTPRDFNIFDGNVRTRLEHNPSYNTAWFGLSLNNLKPDDNQNEVIISTMTSKIVLPPSGSENQLPSYPFLSEDISLLKVQTETLFSDTPFTRTKLIVNATQNFTLNNSEPINSLQSLLTDTWLSTEGFALYNRTIGPTFPGGIEWQFNPLFSKLYRVNDVLPSTDPNPTTDVEILDFGDEATWLIDANYSSGAAYQLDSANNRLEKLESLNLFTWEIHGQETDNTFSASQISGKEYGVIGYSLKLDDSNNVMALFGETLKWDAGGSQMQESQPTTDSQGQPTTHFRSHTLTRNENNIVTGVNILAPITDSRPFFTTQTNEATKDAPGGKFENQGLIGLDGGFDAPVGHSTQNGKHLAFVFNSLSRNNPPGNPLDRGRGIMIATELRPISAFPIFSGERYQIQGNSFGMKDTSNTLRNLNGSTLTISDFLPGDPDNIDCHADLLTKTTTLNHIVDDVVDNKDNTLEPLTLTTSTVEASTACRLVGSEIELQFANVLGQPLTLKGFVAQQDTSPSVPSPRLITLLWIQSDTLGLVFANLEQNLSPTFD